MEVEGKSKTSDFAAEGKNNEWLEKEERDRRGERGAGGGGSMEGTNTQSWDVLKKGWYSESYLLEAERPRERIRFDSETRETMREKREN